MASAGVRLLLMVQVRKLLVAGSASAYYSDRFNRLDFPALVLALGALLATLGAAGPTALTRTLRAAAAGGLWARTLRALVVSPSLGPYVLMVFKMTSDVTTYLLLLGYTLLVFAAAYVALYEPGGDGGALEGSIGGGLRELAADDGGGGWEWPWRTDDGWLLPESAACSSRFSSLPTALLYLLQTSLVAEQSTFDCALASSTPTADCASQGTERWTLA